MWGVQCGCACGDFIRFFLTSEIFFTSPYSLQRSIVVLCLIFMSPVLLLPLISDIYIVSERPVNLDTMLICFKLCICFCICVCVYCVCMQIVNVCHVGCNDL